MDKNHFFTYITSIFNGLPHSFAMWSLGVECLDPFKILHQVLLHFPGVSDELGGRENWGNLSIKYKKNLENLDLKSESAKPFLFFRRSKNIEESNHIIIKLRRIGLDWVLLPNSLHLVDKDL